MGMYVGVSLGGDLLLEVAPGEHYEMNYPTLYLRSYLSEPWMEFGGKINITCPETKMSAGVIFQTKPFYGGKAHHVTAEVKAAGGNTTARLSGDWMAGVYEVSWVDGTVESVDLQTEGVLMDKHVRPVAFQSENESLKLWEPVKRALLAGDLLEAANSKGSVSLCSLVVKNSVVIPV